MTLDTRVSRWFLLDDDETILMQASVQNVSSTKFDVVPCHQHGVRSGGFDLDKIKLIHFGNMIFTRGLMAQNKLNKIRTLPPNKQWTF